MKEKLVPLQTTISLDDSEWIEKEADKRKIPKAHIVREGIKLIREQWAFADNNEVPD